MKKAHPWQIRVVAAVLVLSALACGVSVSDVPPDEDVQTPEITEEAPATETPAPTEVPPTATVTPVAGLITVGSIDRLVEQQVIDPPGIGLASMDWSLDMTRLAVATDTGVIAIWEWTGDSLELLRSQESGIVPAAMAWSPDTRQIALAAQGGISVYDPGRQTVTLTLEGPIDNALRVAWSPNNLIAAGWLNSPAVVWSALSREIVYTVGVDNNAPATGVGVTFSPDGRFLAVGSTDGVVTVMDASTGDVVRTLEEHTAEVRDVTFSPDSDLLASTSLSGEVIVWETLTGEVVMDVIPSEVPVYDIVWSPDETMVATGDAEGILRIWEVQSGTELRQFTIGEEGQTISDLIWSPDGKIIAAASEVDVTLLGLPE